MAIEDADPSLVVRWKSMGKWPLPCQMVFVLKPLMQSQQQGSDNQAEYKHKSRLVICGNFASWGEHSTNTTNLDAPLLRLMLTLSCSKETTWSSIDITSAFLNADIHDDDTVATTHSCQHGCCRKPHAYGKKKETKSFETWNSSIKTSLFTLFRVTSIQAYGSLPESISTL